MAHKGIEPEFRHVRFADVETIRALSGQHFVPIVTDGDRVIHDSRDIACYLEDRFPDRPSLFAGSGGRGLARPDYLREKIWGPIGAEADAAWLVDVQGFEVAHFGFNAILRDYARFGRLLAHDGAWGGRQIIPTQWMIDGTTVPSADSYLAPGKATPSRGYGYLLWLLPGPRRQFALIGQNGQRICIDPASKLVMVQTALEDTPEAWGLWSALVQQFGQA